MATEVKHKEQYLEIQICWKNIFVVLSSTSFFLFFLVEMVTRIHEMDFYVLRYLNSRYTRQIRCEYDVKIIFKHHIPHCLRSMIHCFPQFPAFDVHHLWSNVWIVCNATKMICFLSPALAHLLLSLLLVFALKVALSSAKGTVSSLFKVFHFAMKISRCCNLKFSKFYHSKYKCASLFVVLHLWHLVCMNSTVTSSSYIRKVLLVFFNNHSVQEF